MMQTQLVKKTAIIDSGDFNLSAARYLEKVEINSEFEIKRLGEIIDIVKDKPENFDGTKKYFSTGNVSNDHIGDKYKLVEFNNKPSRANILPKKGDVGFAKMKNTNKVVIIDDILKGSIFSTGFCFIRAKESLFPDYLYHLIKDKRFQESKNELTSDGIMGAIRQNDILNIEIPLPPIDIQEQIVKEIEGYQQIIDGCRQVVENCKPVIDIDPSWDMISLGDEIDFISGITLSVTNSLNDNGINIITMADINEDGEIDISKIRKVNPGNKKFNLCKKGDLLFNWRNGSKHLVGKTAYFNLEGEYIFASFCHGIRVKENFDPYFLWVILNQYRRDGVYLKYMREVVNGLFNRDEINTLKVPIPKIEIQREIVEKLEQERNVIEGNRELIQIYENKINARINKVWSDN